MVVSPSAMVLLQYGYVVGKPGNTRPEGEGIGAADILNAVGGGSIRGGTFNTDLSVTAAGADDRNRGSRYLLP